MGGSHMSLQLIINGISLGAVYALIAVGFAIVFSVLKFSNFAHGGMISASAYIAFFFQRAYDTPPPLWVTILFTSVMGMIMALAVDTLGYRRIRKKHSPALFYFLSSVTFAIFIEQFLNVFYGKNMYGFPPVFETTTFQIAGITLSTLDMVILAVAVGLLMALIMVVHGTKLGLAIRTVAIDSRASRLMGINSAVVIMFTFVLAGLLAGVSGVLLGIKYSVYPSLGSSMMVKGFIASVIGGLGSLGGAITAAVLLGLVEMILTYYLGSSITPALLFGIMLLFLFVRPQGIAGKFTQDKA
jgi:branched-chain amino acid transport system permease protein